MIELYSDTLEAPGDGPDNEILSHFAPHLFTKDADATITVHERKSTAIARYCTDDMAD